MEDVLNYAGYIDRYLDGIMTDVEKVWFEKEIVGNPDLQAELDLYKKINATIADKEVMELKAQLDYIHNEIQEPEIPYRSKALRRVGFVVGVAATFIIGFLTIQNTNQSYDKLVGKYYEPIEVNMNFRSATVEASPNLKDAMKLYESGDYQSAISEFEKIIALDDSKIGIKLYSGISHMEVKDYQNANQRFNQVINHKENVFVESAQWYLGFCYILTEDLDNAKLMFEQLASKEGYYQKDARKILKRL